MADALQLLESNRVAVGQAFQQVYGAMESMTRTATDAAQFKATTANMQFNMAETARRTDADIASTAFKNNLAAAEHQVNMSLMPLRLETEKVKLERAKIENERSLYAAQQAEFNTIAGPWKEIAASNFAKNQNPDYAKGYLQVESAWRSRIARGETFDPNAFSKDISYLNSQYGAVEDKEGYNPEVSHLLRAMGSPSEAARYETKNPVFSGNMAGLKASAIIGGPNGFAAVASKYGHLFDEKEMGNLAIAAESYGSFETVLEGLDKNRRMIHAQINQYPDGDARRDDLIEQLSQISGEINSIRSQRDGVFKSVISGNSGTPAAKVETVNPLDSLTLQVINEYQTRKTGAEGLNPAPANSTDTREDRALIDRNAFGAQQVRGRFPQAMEGIPLKPFRGSDLTDNPEGVRSLRRQILRNLDEVDDIRALFDSAIKPGKGDTPSKFRQIFDKIGENDVALEDDLRTDLYEVYGTSTNPNGTREYGRMNMIERAGDLGGLVSSLTGKAHIQNIEDLQEIVSQFKGTPTQERLLLQDLYANMVLVDLISSYR